MKCLLHVCNSKIRSESRTLADFRLWLYEINPPFSKTRSNSQSCTHRDFPANEEQSYTDRWPSELRFWSKWRELWRKAGGRKVISAISGKPNEERALAVVAILSGAHQPHRDMGVPAWSQGPALSPYWTLAGKRCWGNSTGVFTAGFTYSSTPGGTLSVADSQRQTGCSDCFPADVHPELRKRARAQLNLCVNEVGSCERSIGTCDVPAQLWVAFLGRRPPPPHVRNLTKSLVSVWSNKGIYRNTKMKKYPKIQAQP